MFPPEVLGEEEVLDVFVEQARAAQRAAVADLDAGGTVECVVPVGRDWAESVGGVDWRHGDVLVLGSSPGGVLSRVFLGSHATRILRHSPVPVVVFPA
jgi:nucleotide-binding universal stress UspA family protein